MMRGLDRHRPANILIRKHGADANLATVRRRYGSFPWGQVPGGPGTARAENPIGEVI